MVGMFAASVGQHLHVSPLEVGFPMGPSSRAVFSPAWGDVQVKGIPFPPLPGLKTNKASEGRRWRRGGSCFLCCRGMRVVGAWVNVRAEALGEDGVSGGALAPQHGSGEGGIMLRPVPASMSGTA